MKNVTLFVLALFVAMTSFAQESATVSHTETTDNAYTTAMKQAIALLEEDAQLQAASNMFERIANIADKEWLPQYYLAYASTNLAWAAINEKDYDTFDGYIKKAENALEVAMTVAGGEAELYVLKAYIYQAKIMRNPMINGARFHGTIVEALEKATELDENNPRAYYLHAQQLQHLPSFLGGGVEEAIPMFEKATEKFSSFVPMSELHPNWGAINNERALSYLQNN